MHGNGDELGQGIPPTLTIDVAHVTIAEVGANSNVFNYDVMSGRYFNLSLPRRRADALRV